MRLERLTLYLTTDAFFLRVACWSREPREGKKNSVRIAQMRQVMAPQRDPCLCSTKSTTCSAAVEQLAATCQVPAGCRL